MNYDGRMWKPVLNGWFLEGVQSTDTIGNCGRKAGLIRPYSSMNSTVDAKLEKTFQ